MQLFALISTLLTFEKCFCAFEYIEILFKCIQIHVYVPVFVCTPLEPK